MERRNFLSSGVTSGLALSCLPTFSYAQEGSRKKPLKPCSVLPQEPLAPGPGNLDEIITGTENNYKAISADTKFAINSKNPMDKPLDILKAHAGELKMNTKEGEGSEFIIQLPIT